MIGIDRFSICACPVTTFCQGHVVGDATAFFWKKGSQIYLVSNWHVFSGREPSSGQPKDKNYGAVPDKIHVKGSSKKNPNEKFSIELPLCDKEGNVLWKQHKVLGQRVDVALLIAGRVSALNKSMDHIPCLNEMPLVSDMITQVGHDVFVLGFPLKIMTTGMLPIWKRASIATDPDHPVNDMACILIDTATREGMSGAPVLQRAAAYRQRDGSHILAGQDATQFLGVYSGRYVGELGEAQLGIVWKREFIDEILLDPAPGSFTLA